MAASGNLLCPPSAFRTLPAITLVVASCHRPGPLATLLGSVGTQTLETSAFEVAVVIDGFDSSEMKYRDILERCQGEAAFRLRYEFQLNAGPALARHRAIAAATTPWVCVVDDDMELSPAFLSEHLTVLRAGTSKTIVIGRVVPDAGWERASIHEAMRTHALLGLHNRLAQGTRRPTAHAFMTGNVSFPRSFYVSIGGFDQNLRLAEDTELGLRFEFAGAQFVFADKASAVHHMHLGKYEEWLRRCIEYGTNAVYIYSKLERDSRAHPLRNLVNGSRLNAAVVHALCWSESLAKCGIATLRWTGQVLRLIGLLQASIATHKAILAVAFHVGVRRALGSWRLVLETEHSFAADPKAPRDPT